MRDALLLERRSERMRAFSMASRAEICALSTSCSLLARSRRQLGALLRARDLDLALLRQARVFGFAVDVERQLLGFQVLVADRDHRVLLDVVALLLAPLDLLGQTRQAFGVERVARVEELHRGLVELGQRRRFELEPVLEQVVGDRPGARA